MPRKRRITREEVAEILSYNGDYINRVFKKQTGRSILNYCQTVCMEEAARLLSTTTLDVQTIIKQLRYENRTHFNRLFKEYFQMTPGEYRVRHRKAMK
ncbi:helix-turn-helix transcriptional regulator [Murimonas intestini]|uniref:helix-turn-helix transcriptional regulator n=1 Tax=Murimonas intestini TaxID=1337051 RepID=UPI000D6BD86E